MQSPAVKIVHHNNINWTPLSHDPQIVKKVILGNGEAANITQLSRTRILPGQSTTPHTHKDMAEIYTIEIGTLSFTVNGTTSKVEGPASVLIMPGDLHALANNSDQPIELLYIGVLSPV